MTDNTTPERQSLRQVIAQTSKAVRTGPIELRRAAEVAATLNASRPSPNSPVVQPKR